METYDFLGARVVVTAAGPVDISLAAHADGTWSAVAWLSSSGRRVGYLRRHPRARHLDETAIDPALVESGLERSMAAMLDAAFESQGQMPPTEPTPPGPAASEVAGLQWLLDELGEHSRLSELIEAADTAAPSAAA